MDFGFQDEMRVGPPGTLTRLWAPAGTRCRGRQQHSAYAYGFRPVVPVRLSDTSAMAEATPEGRHAVVVVDGAG